MTVCSQRGLLWHLLDTSHNNKKYLIWVYKLNWNWQDDFRLFCWPDSVYIIYCRFSLFTANHDYSHFQYVFLPIKSLLLRMKCVAQHYDLQMLVSKWTYVSIFIHLKVLVAVSFNPFTTEARFSVLNAMAFSTEKRASVVKGLRVKIK